MALTYSAIRDFVQEFGRNLLNEQANLAAPLLVDKDVNGQKVPKVIPIKDIPTEVGTVQVKNGGFGSTGAIQDGGSHNAGDSLSFFKGYYGPKIYTARPLFPIAMSRIAAGGSSGINIVREQFETAGQDVYRYLERSIINAQVASPFASVSAGASSMTVEDPSGYRPGMTIDVYNGASFVEAIQVSTVSIPASGNSTVTFATNTVNAWTTSYTVWLHGQSPSDFMASFAGINDSTTGLYTNLSATTFPSGENDSSSTSWTNTLGGGLIDRIARRTGKRPTHIVASSVGRRRIYGQANPQLRFMGDSKMDVFGPDLMFDGLPIAVTENQSDTTIDFVNNREFFLHRFYDFGLDGDGGEHSKGMNESGLQLSQSSYNYQAPISGAFNLHVKQRLAFGRFSALTS